MDCASVEALPAANPVRGSITMLLWGGVVSAGVPETEEW